jgi:hypothetical protein
MYNGKIEFWKMQVAYGLIKDIRDYHIHIWSSFNSSPDKTYGGKCTIDLRHL